MEEFADYNLSSPNVSEMVRRIKKIKAEKPTTKGRFSEQTFLNDFQDPLLQKLRERYVGRKLHSNCYETYCIKFKRPVDT